MMMTGGRSEEVATTMLLAVETFLPQLFDLTTASFDRFVFEATVTVAALATDTSGATGSLAEHKLLLGTITVVS
jgi:hypothetical protein